MGLNLRCELCGRHQVGGLLSAAAWGRLDEPDGPQACPDCMRDNPDWRKRLEAAASD